MEINKALETLQLTLPFTEEELNDGYKTALKSAVDNEDSSRVQELTKSFWRIKNYIRTNPFISNKINAKEVKENEREVYSIKVTEKCKKCAPKHIERGLYIPSGKSTIICPKCNGQKDVFIPSKEMLLPCKKCKGMGFLLVTCKYCRGTGKVNLNRKVFALTKKESIVNKEV